MIELFGWTSTFLLGFCGIPQAFKAWKTKSAADISYIFLLMWLLGEIFACIYVLNINCISGIWQVPLLANYSLNIIIVIYLLYIKYCAKHRHLYCWKSQNSV